MTDWQSIAALAVVIFTAAVFIFRALRRRGKKSGCGGGCGCPMKPKAPAGAQTRTHR